MALPGPIQERSARRMRARRVRRLVRHVEPWSVLKVSLIMYFCGWVVVLFVGVTLWQLADGAGLISNIENFVTELGALESFEIHGNQIFRIAAVGGLMLVVAFTGLTVLAAVVFNLVSDLTGGVRVTVVEEETARLRVRRTGHNSSGHPPTGPMPGTMPGAPPVPGAKPPRQKFPRPPKAPRPSKQPRPPRQKGTPLSEKLRESVKKARPNSSEPEDAGT